MRVPFGWRAFGQASRRNPRPIQIALRLLHFATIQAGWLTDEVLQPGWKAARYQGPLFILGHQRSATTALHRALCDSEHAIGSSLWQMAMPSLSLWKSARALSTLDKNTGRRLGSWIERHAARLFSPLDDVHFVRPGEVEEDEFYFWSLFASSMCLNGNSSTMDGSAQNLLRYPEHWDVEWSKELMQWYADILRKLVQFSDSSPPTGLAPWVIAKNPAFSHRIPQLLAQFPDARFIVLHRDPRQAIASRLGLIQRVWNSRNSGARLNSGQVELIYQDSKKIYLGLEEQKALIPECHLLELTTGVLADTPQQVCATIADLFGIHINLSQRPAARSKPTSLEQFGLSPDRIERDLAPVFQNRRWN